MSLVNEALKKARLEAARGEAAKRGIPYPALGGGDRNTGQTWIAVLAVTVLLTSVTGFLLYRAGKRSALEQQIAGPSNPTPSAVATASDRPAAPASPATDSGPRPTPAEPARRQPADILLEDRPATESPERAPRREEAPGLAPAQLPKASPASETPPASARQAVDEAPAAPPAIVREKRPAPSAAPAVAATAETPRETADVPPTEAPAVPTPEPLDSESAPTTEAREMTNDAAVREFVRRAEIPGVGPMELGGIAWSGDRPFALINGRVVRPGDSVLGLMVETIEPNRVSLSGDAGRLVFTLK